MREIRRKDGGVVILHCIHPQSATLVGAIVPALIEEGYDFVRLDEVPGYRKFEMPPEEPGTAVASSDSLTALPLSSAIQLPEGQPVTDWEMREYFEFF